MDLSTYRNQLEQEVISAGYDMERNIWPERKMIPIKYLGVTMPLLKKVIQDSGAVQRSQFLRFIDIFGPAGYTIVHNVSNISAQNLLSDNGIHQISLEDAVKNYMQPADEHRLTQREQRTKLPRMNSGIWYQDEAGLERYLTNACTVRTITVLDINADKL